MTRLFLALAGFAWFGMIEFIRGRPQVKSETAWKLYWVGLFGFVAAEIVAFYIRPH